MIYRIKFWKNDSFYGEVKTFHIEHNNSEDIRSSIKNAGYVEDEYELYSLDPISIYKFDDELRGIIKWA